MIVQDSLLPWALGALLIAMIAQCFHWPLGALGAVGKYVLWAVGLVAWFGSGVISFAHALS